jgi:hypothetical protein
MVDHKYFAHDSLDGRDVVARLREVRYIPARGEWVIGENLVWGSGALATPRALVNAWMNSPPHRQNLLAVDFREVGLGVVFGTPSRDAPDGVTVTTDFGTRSGATPAGSAPGGTPGVSNTPGAGAGVAGTAAGQAATARRRAALRRCTQRRAAAKRRCVRAARRIR